MRWFNVLVARLRALVRRDAVIDDIDEEMRLHVDLETEANLARGMAPEEARRAALASFGHVGQHRDVAYDVRGGGLLETLWQDLRYGLRTLARSPGFTAVSVLTLALGIGANTAIFSVVNGLLLTSLPFEDPDRLALMFGTAKDGSRAPLSYSDLDDYREQTEVFESLSPLTFQSVNLTGLERPDRVRGGFVSADFFAVLRARPELGRALVAGEDRPGAENVAVLDHRAWAGRFGADPNILGTALVLNGEPFTVVGVMPADFRFPIDEVEVWLPAHKYPNYKPGRSSRNFVAIGRLRPGVDVGAAQGQLTVAARRLADTYPEDEGAGVEVTGLREVLVRDIRPAVLLLAGAVGLILLIACANIANLLLARAANRQREIAVRMAIGAGRRRVMRQLLTESVLLSLLGGLAGLLLAWKGVEPLRAIATDLSAVGPIELDGRVLAFTLLASLATGLLFGLAPAFQLVRARVPDALKGDRSTGGGFRHQRVRNAFVVVQIALSLVLLVGAGLLIRSFGELVRVEPGFDPKNLLTMEYRMPRTKYPDPAAQAEFHRQVAERAGDVPGVVSAAVVSALPLSGNGGGTAVVLPDRPATPGEEPEVLTLAVTPNYFATMRIPILRGRAFAADDGAEAPAVIVVSQAMAERSWPGDDPVGKRVDFPTAKATATVVGVAGDVKHYTLDEEIAPEIYTPYAQNPGIFGTLVVRTAAEPTGLADAARSAVWAVDKDQPVWKIRTQESLVDRNLATARNMMALMSVFGLVALVLAALGIYGVISYSVSQRTREIGVRLALGAEARDVFRLIVGGGLVLAVVGVAVGLVAAAGLTRVMASLLYGVTSTDPVTFVVVPVVLTAVAALACFVPARRATKTDPMRALRDE